MSTPDKPLVRNLLREHESSFFSLCDGDSNDNLISHIATQTDATNTNTLEDPCAAPVLSPLGETTLSDSVACDEYDGPVESSIDTLCIERVVGALYDLARAASVVDLCFSGNSSTDLHEVFSGLAVDADEDMDSDPIICSEVLDRMQCLEYLCRNENQI